MRRASRAIGRLAMVAPAVLAGWLLHDFAELASSAAASARFVDDAVTSHQVLVLRDGMRSQPEAPNYDVAELQRNTAVRMPALPAGWRVLDVQVLPSNDGPSVQALVRLQTGDRVGLIGIRSETPGGSRPLLERHRGENIAYWEEGDFAFALVGRAPPSVLLSSALSAPHGCEKALKRDPGRLCLSHSDGDKTRFAEGADRRRSGLPRQL